MKRFTDALRTALRAWLGVPEDVHVIVVNATDVATYTEAVREAREKRGMAN